MSNLRLEAGELNVIITNRNDEQSCENKIQVVISFEVFDT